MLNTVLKPLLFVLACLSMAEAQAGNCLNIKAPQGRYGVNLQGRLVSGAPYAAVGTVNLSTSSFTLNLKVSEGGAFSDKAIQGTVLLEDCGLTLASTDTKTGFVLKGQLADRGKEIFVTEIQSSNPVVASGLMRPVGLKSCSTETLKGHYDLVSQGYTLGSAGYAPVGAVGDEVFNGKGCSAYSMTVKNGADIVDSSAIRSYQVYENCTFELDTSGQPSLYGVVVDKGQGLAIMTLAPGTVRTGEFSRSGSDSKAAGCP
jgi:hypothetical protein